MTKLLELATIKEIDLYQKRDLTMTFFLDMDEEIEFTAEEAGDLKRLNDTYADFSEVSIRSEEYPEAVERFKSAITAFARHHRNWNDKTGMPDGMYDYFDGEFVGQRPGQSEPKILPEEIHNVEEIIEELLYDVVQGKIDDPTPKSIYAFERIESSIARLKTYHPSYDYRTEKIR